MGRGERQTMVVAEEIRDSLFRHLPTHTEKCYGLLQRILHEVVKNKWE